MRSFTGTGVALITPFDREGELDEVSLRTLVNHVIAGNADFLVALGTTAEVATMSPLEREQVVKIILSENNGRLPVMVGVGGYDTRGIVRELRELTWLKSCDAVLSVTPYYNKPSQQGLFEHFRAVAEASPLPVCLYNVPGRTGINMTAETTIRLSRECPNILGIKEASGNFDQSTEILKGRREGFLALSGDDGIVLPLMSMGFEGVISVIANAYPAEMTALTRAVREGNYTSARKIHLKLSVMCRAIFTEGNPAGIKALLHHLGIIRNNTLRLPLTSVSEGLYSQIELLADQL